jgi:MFS family permease
MQATHPQTDQELTRMEIRALTLASLGGALEFYDFVVFVFFTAAISKLFFAASLPDWVKQFQTFGIFAAGYLARPLGGIVMGHFGDTRGRKRMFTLSVLLMAIPTLIIGLLPTYQSIGVLAPLLLLTMRIMQGIAIGGEAPGGWVFVAEHARRGRSGFAIGLLTCGLTAGILLGSIVATGLSLAYTPVQIVNGGVWRVPFVLGGIFCFIAMFLRRWLKETPVFEELRARAAVSREVPLRTVLAKHGRAIVASILSTWALTAAIVVVILMSPALLQHLFAVAPRNAQMANLLGTLALCVSTVIVGAATDRFGVRRVAVPSLLLLIAATYGLYAGAVSTPSRLMLFYAVAGFGAGAVTVTPILMVRSFPSAIRFSGVSFSYNTAYAIFGGLTPLLISWMVHYNRFAPAHYVAATSVLGIVSAFIMPTIDSLNVRATTLR